MRVEIGVDALGDGCLQATVEVIFDGPCGLVDGWELAEESFLRENVRKRPTAVREVRVEVGLSDEDRKSRERGPRPLDVPERRLGQASGEFRYALNRVL